MELKKTPFYHKHLESKGKLVDFNGWALPVEYNSILAEAKNIRTHCGMFDVSHMGEILISGEGALAFLQNLTSNDITLAGSLKMQYNLFINESGGVVDDFMLYSLEKGYLCVVNASNKDKVLNRLKSMKPADCQIKDQSQRTALISLQGPNSSKIISKIFGPKIADLGYLHFMENLNQDILLISRSGYTGEDGFELYFHWDKSLKWWDKIIEAGEGFDVVFCGLGARDILRIEAGLPLYGHELNEDINPLQAGLGWAVKLNKNFIGKDKILEEKNQGLKNIRVGFIMQDRAVAREGYCIYKNDKKIGQVSSGTYSANLNKFIGMAYLEKDHSNLGTEINIDIRGKRYKAKVADFPFIDFKNKKRRPVKEEVA